MTKSALTRERILQAAEKRVRAVGFHAVSFRDLAADCGVRSASIHYYFPRKEDLGVALVGRYAERFRARLDRIDIDGIGPSGALAAFAALYGEALVVGKSVCLCAILGAEANGLPARIKAATRAFFEANAAWLAGVQRRLPPSKNRITPMEIVSALQGAMIVSSVMKTREPFDATARRIVTSHKGPPPPRTAR